MLVEGEAFDVQTCQVITNIYSELKSFCHHERPDFAKVQFKRHLR
jgi:hypothetical protein